MLLSLAGLGEDAITPEKTAGKRAAKSMTAAKGTGPVCELCAGRRNLRKTECGGRWICDDGQKYVMFSYSRNSCDRNHRRYKLYGTNEHNFETLEKPPTFEATKCGATINLGNDGYSKKGREYFCMRCGGL